MTLLGGFGTFPNKQENTPLTFAESGYTPLQNDAVITIDTSGGAFTLNLPDIDQAPMVFRQSLYYISKTTADANTLTISPFGADTIGGLAADLDLTTVESVLLYAPNGGNDWVVLGRGSAGPVVVSGLIPQEFVFGSPLGFIDQTSGFTYDPALNRLQFLGSPLGFTAFTIGNTNAANAPEFSVQNFVGDNSRIYATNQDGVLALLSVDSVAGVLTAGVTGDFCDEVLFSAGASGTKARLDGPLVKVGTVDATEVEVGRTGQTIEARGNLRVNEGTRINLIEVSADYTALVTDSFILYTADADLFLPPISTARRCLFWVRKGFAGGNIKIHPDGADTINGVGAAVSQVVDFSVVQIYATETGDDWAITLMVAL